MDKKGFDYSKAVQDLIDTRPVWKQITGTILKEIIPDKNLLKDVMNISIPTTSSRLIGSIGYFFEPIIFLIISANKFIFVILLNPGI